MINWIENTKENRSKFLGKYVYFYQSNDKNVSSVFKGSISPHSDIEDHDAFLCFIEGIYSGNLIDTYNTAKQIYHETCQYFCTVEEFDTILPPFIEKDDNDE
jgi:hypothetical protein